jgi:hypothetical protein
MASNETKPRAAFPKVPAPLFITGMILACVFAGWLGIVAGRPFVLARHMRQENAKIEARLRDMRMETQTMRKEVAALSTEVGMERQARQRGYVRQGEQLLVIPPTGRN